jgi:hypothetical protein
VNQNAGESRSSVGRIGALRSEVGSLLVRFSVVGIRAREPRLRWPNFQHLAAHLKLYGLTGSQRALTTTAQ